MVGAPARREQARYAIARGVKHRLACTLIKTCRFNLHYRLKMPDKNAPIIKAMRRLSGQYPRFGSRRIRIFLQREGFHLGKERCARLWAEAGLQVPKKRKRQRAKISEHQPNKAENRNAVWSYDFVYDACANGQKLKCLTIVDEFTRECLAIDVAGTIRSARVIEVLSQLITIHGTPLYMRSDNVLSLESIVI